MGSNRLYVSRAIGCLGAVFIVLVGCPRTVWAGIGASPAPTGKPISGLKISADFNGTAYKNQVGIGANVTLGSVGAWDLLGGEHVALVQDIFRKLEFDRVAAKTFSFEACAEWDPITNKCKNGSYDWLRTDKVVDAIKAIGVSSAIMTLPVGTWGNGNTLPNNFPMNTALPIDWPSLSDNRFGYMPQLEAYCQYVGEIVRHINIDNGLGVKYWEIGNEVPVGLSTAIANYYMTLFNKAEVCIHAVDPTVLISTDRGGRGSFAGTFRQKGNNVGFISLHDYASVGSPMYPYNPTNTDFTYYPPDNKYGWMTDAYLMSQINELSDASFGSLIHLHDTWLTQNHKDLEIDVSELNMNSATINGYDPRATGIFMAPWLAARYKAYTNLHLPVSLQIFSMMGSGGTKPMVNNGGWGLSMVNSKYPYELYSGYWATYMLTHYFPKGVMLYPINSSNGAVVDALATKMGNVYRVLLINKYDGRVTFNLTLTGVKPSSMTMHLLDSTTYVRQVNSTTQSMELVKSEIQDYPVLPSQSLNLTFNGYTLAVLEVSTDLLGDLNGDLKVDTLDYNIILTDFGKTGTAGWIPADIDKNGIVDIYDYNIMINNFGK